MSWEEPLPDIHVTNVDIDNTEDLLGTDASEAVYGFVDSNHQLFIDYVRGWYEPERAERILQACGREGILEYAPD